jgi:hypothetical protein
VKFLSVRQRINYNTLMMLFKLERALLPEYLCCNLNQVNKMHTHNTRGGSDFTLPYFRRALTQNSLSYNDMQLYNNLRRSDEFKNIRTVNGFQWLAKNFVKTLI